MKGEIKMKIPDKENINIAIKIRDKMLSWNQVNDLLIHEFSINKENKDLHQIGYKIELVNKLYNCNLNLNKREVAEEIRKLELDEKFNQPENLVQKIASINFPGIYRRSVGFVFSSKYCHFHYPDKFPIYDRFARIALGDLTGRKRSVYLNNYSQFKKDIDKIISKLDWKSSYKEMDDYLWLYGQWLYYKEKESQNKQVFSRRITHLLQKHKKLFSNLEPEKSEN